MKRLAAAIGLQLLLMGVATAQGIVVDTSDPLVSINSTFIGETITLFGNIAPGTASVPLDESYDVVVLVEGPPTDRLVRAKERSFGIMVDTRFSTYRDLPGFYAVLSSTGPRRLSELPHPYDLKTGFETLAARARLALGDQELDVELIRLMKQQGLFLLDARGISFLSPTTFVARFPLPSYAPSGLYVVEALAIADGDVVAVSSTSFTVRKEGSGRYIAAIAESAPAAYGLVTVLMALLTGWLGGILFKR